MSLSTRFTVWLAAIFVGLLAVFSALYIIFANDYFSALETDLEQRELLRAQALVDSQLEDVTYVAENYAYWDETYSFMSAPNEQYIEANFSPDELEFNQVNLIAFFDLAKVIGQ